MGEFLTYREWLEEFGYKDSTNTEQIYEEWVDAYYALLAMKSAVDAK